MCTKVFLSEWHTWCRWQMCMEEADRAITGICSMCYNYAWADWGVISNTWCILSYKMRDIQSLGLQWIDNLACMKLRHRQWRLKSCKILSNWYTELGSLGVRSAKHFSEATGVKCRGRGRTNWKNVWGMNDIRIACFSSLNRDYLRMYREN